MKYLSCQKVCWQEEATEEAAAAGEERSCRMLTIGDCEIS